jgi:sugar O-acyltransferase (sialic acid O-acetyltransferase NeuD family)
MRRELIIVGSGGFARETAQLVATLPEWRLAGFLDDDPARHGTLVDGVPVLAAVTEAGRWPDARFVVCTGNPRDFASRAQIVERLGLPPHRYATLVHPTAWVSPSSATGPGSVLLAQVVLTAAVQVGSHVAIMPQTVLTHDDVVESFATLASGVRVGGAARIGVGAYLGAGALVREGVTVGAGAMAGMGAVVTRDIPPGELWIGAPARFLRPAPGSGPRPQGDLR